jgi:hypothetical protein
MELVDNVRRVSPLAEGWDPLGAGVERFGLTLTPSLLLPNFGRKYSGFPGVAMSGQNPRRGVRG